MLSSALNIANFYSLSAHKSQLEQVARRTPSRQSIQTKKEISLSHSVAEKGLNKTNFPVH